MNVNARRRALETMPTQQAQCLRMVARGFRSKEIARELNLSAHTVDGHLRRALVRLEVSGRNEAARLFLEFEATTQPLSTQALSIEPAAPISEEERVETQSAAVNEGRQAFVAFPASPVVPIDRWPHVRRLSTLQTLVLIAVLVATAAVVLSCAYPIGDGAQHLADWLSPRPHH